MFVCQVLAVSKSGRYRVQYADDDSEARYIKAKKVRSFYRAPAEAAMVLGEKDSESKSQELKEEFITTVKELLMQRADVNATHEAVFFFPTHSLTPLPPSCATAWCLLRLTIGGLCWHSSGFVDPWPE